MSLLCFIFGHKMHVRSHGKSTRTVACKRRFCQHGFMLRGPMAGALNRRDRKKREVEILKGMMA